MSSSTTRAFFAPLGTGFEQARQMNAVLLVRNNGDAAVTQVAQAFTAAHSCGSVLYEDNAAVVVRPSS